MDSRDHDGANLNDNPKSEPQASVDFKMCIIGNVLTDDSA